MAELKIYQFSCLQDNFGVLIHDTGSGLTASIDAPESGAVVSALEETGWTLSHILVTHHHHDHVGGVDSLKSAFGCRVVGPKADAHRIPNLDVLVAEGDSFEFGAFRAKIFGTPGHTSGHIAYWFEDPGVLFAGDTMFSLGCGRLFEGSANDMWASLTKLMALPPETKLYCGHEYTLANGLFALTIEPGNADLISRVDEVKRLVDQGQPTLPSTLMTELKTNPFLRASSREIRRNLDMQHDSDATVFAEIRKRKDNS